MVTGCSSRILYTSQKMYDEKSWSGLNASKTFIRQNISAILSRFSAGKSLSTTVVDRGFLIFNYLNRQLDLALLCLDHLIEGISDF